MINRKSSHILSRRMVSESSTWSQSERRHTTPRTRWQKYFAIFWTQNVPTFCQTCNSLTTIPGGQPGGCRDALPDQPGRHGRRRQEAKVCRQHGRCQERDTFRFHFVLSVFPWLDSMQLCHAKSPDRVGNAKNVGSLLPLDNFHINSAPRWWFSTTRRKRWFSSSLARLQSLGLGWSGIRWCSF